MNYFEIPVALFIFKRIDKSLQIINKLSEIQPKKIYLLADEGRNEEEKKIAHECRRKIEEAIWWKCEIVKHFAEVNIGVYENIGCGAKWVLEREKMAIFLEDDNFPENSFFLFCQKMLEKYKDNDRILWICGTNYLKKYNPKDGSDYLFSRHMFPCGWANWSDKFLKYYDGELLQCTKDNLDLIRDNYLEEQMYYYDVERLKIELERKERKERFLSWDYQMAFSLRYYNKLGIIPKYNQIKNIGVDDFSIHGGNSRFNVMTRRFCMLKTYHLNDQLRHPKCIDIDENFERKINKIVIPPKPNILKRIIRKIFDIPNDVYIMEGIKYKLRGIHIRNDENVK